MSPATAKTHVSRRSTTPRILALLGAALIVVASTLPWNQYDLVMASSGASAARIHGVVDLWSIDPLAAALISGAALTAALLLVVAGHRLRAARHLAGMFGLAIAAYALSGWFASPALAGVLSSTRRAHVLTGGASVDTGIFIMLLGGAALVLAALEPAASIPAPSSAASRRD